MAKSAEQQPAEGKGLVSDETKDKIKEGLQNAGQEIREKVTEKAIEAIEKAIAKLEEVLAWLKPHVEPVVQDAALHIQTAIDKLKKSKEGK
jgi:hypothetical protein